MVKVKKLLKGSKDFGLFAGGALFAGVASKVLTSKTARNIYVNTLAKGMHVVDEVNSVVSNVKQGAEDIYEEAQDVYAEEKQAEALESVESVESDDEEA